jgi:hypothetical protein
LNTRLGEQSPHIGTAAKAAIPVLLGSLAVRTQTTTTDAVEDTSATARPNASETNAVPVNSPGGRQHNGAGGFVQHQYGAVSGWQNAPAGLM